MPIFHDCMPMMADVFSGVYPRPTEFAEGEDPILHIVGSLAEKRIKESFGENMTVIATKGSVPTSYTKQVEALRKFESDAPVILVGHTLIAFNADATSFATEDVARTKGYSETLQAAAEKLLQDKQVDITDKVDTRIHGKDLMKLTGCSYNIARQHIAKAARRLRGQLVQRQWGGTREGAGRPKDSES